jgi:hypothetical protein
VEQTDEFVHALARAGESAGEPCSRVAPFVGEDASAAARALACGALADRLGVARERLSIAKRGRIPVLCADGAPAQADLSLSHHGRFVAFACELAAGAIPARLAS